MKKILIIALCAITTRSFGQTTVTVDASDVLTSNSKIVAATAGGQSFFTGHQVGATYGFPAAIFRAITDNPIGAYNYFYDGVTNGNLNFSIRADGQGYFAGKVGIGTPSPIATLNVAAIGTSLTGTVYLNTAFVQDNTTLRGVFTGYDTSDQTGVIAAGSQGTSSNLAFWNYNSATSSWLERMRIVGNGNVGIGTASPVAKLTIAGNGNLNPNPGAETDYTDLNLTFKGESDGGNFNLGSIKMVQPAGAFLDNADMTFSTCFQNSTEKMRITGTGNVGIGKTDTKGYKLAVNGSVIATSVVVKLYSTWPDYVFKATYHLTPLAKVKTFIDQNHRLPDMPSDKEVAKNGLDVGEANRLLTKKVEELTLYLIEKDNQLKAVTNKLDDLNAKVDRLMNSKEKK